MNTFTDRMTVWDVETLPLPDDQLIKPEFVANKTLRDPDKIKADLAAKEAEWRERLALDATTCRIAMIGFMGNPEPTILQGGEKDMLKQAWAAIDFQIGKSDPVIGFNCFGFDLPVMVRRSWALGVRIPLGIRRGRYWDDSLIDLMEVWTCGKREQTISLNNLCKFLKIGEKSGSGADFGKLTVEEQVKYLTADLLLTRKCAERLLG